MRIAAVAVACLALAGTAVPQPTAASVPHVARSTDSPRHWTYHADVDGDGHPDRIRITAGSDLKPGSLGWTGHYTVSVHLSSTGKTVTHRLHLAYYFSAYQRFTPWYGAAHLIGWHRKQLVLGRENGAHTVLFHVLSLRHNRLVSLPAPAASRSGWFINASFGTGEQGWRCVAHGIEYRDVHPVNEKITRFRVTRSSFVRHGSGWKRIHHFSAVAPAGSGHQPPRRTQRYASFACAGLPSNPRNF